MEGYFSCVAGRESCRKYEDKPVEREKLVKMLEAARIAPSACNGQPWRFTVVTRPETVKELAKCVQGAGMNGFASQCPAFIVVEEVKANLSARVGAAIKGNPFAPIDVGLATMQMCLAATAQGLSTCILGWFSAEKIRKLLAMEGEGTIRLVVCVGYAAPGELRTKTRKPLEAIARFVE